MKKITIALSFVLLCILSYGQEVSVEETDLSMEELFENLNPNLITTGILIDRVPIDPELFNLEDYNGSCSECILSAVGFEQMLLNLKTSRFWGNEYLDGTQERYQSFLVENKKVPIHITNILYNQFKLHALDSNYLDTTEGVYDEGENTSGTPYNTKRFVALAIPGEFFAQDISFTLKSDFYLSNDENEITKMEIDFGDGEGYRIVEFDETIAPHYSEIPKGGVTISIKLTIGEEVYIAKTKTVMTVCGSSNIPTPVAPPWSNSSQFQYGNLVANETNSSSGHATGNAYVYYRPNATGNQFKKPLIVVEGIDFGPYNQQNAANYQMGSFGWCALWGASPDYAQLAEMPELLSDFHDEGYDIIMLDFKDGATDIKENAFLLQALIEKVNQYKTSDAEANVVIGASMGAIVTRYALADMEKDGKNHCTRMYVSFDGPHQGANIPIGAQHFIDFFATNSVKQIESAKKFLYGALARPAAKQLLKVQLKSTWADVHTQFYNDLNTLGYPTQCKNISVVSGSGGGTNQGYSGGAQIVDYNHTASSFFGLYVDGNIWSLPGRSSDNMIFHGQMPYFNGLFSGWGSTQRKVYVGSGFPHYDNAPGGIRRVAQEIAATNTGGNGTIYALKANQCFIPAISALDVNTTNLFYDINYAIQQGTLQTPFDDYYLPNNNTLHVEVTDGNPSGSGNNIVFTFNRVTQGQGVSNTTLTGTYNYGEKLHDQVTHTLVHNGGRLHLYGNFADSYTQNTPASGNTHTYYLGSGCNEEMLEIGNNGELILGNSSVDNKAIFIINEQSTIKVKSGGKIIVNNGSTLLISEGANFIFEDGAELVLSGYGSFLKFQGKFTIGNNADFTFTGLGRLIFDQNVKWALNSSGNYYLKLDEFWDIGQNTTFKLAGPLNPLNYNHNLIEVYKPVYFKTENGSTFNQVKIENGRIALHKDALLFSFSPTIMRRMKIESAYNWELHGGFRLWNNSGPNSLYDCHFKNGYPATLFHWVGGGAPITLLSCTFEDNIEGFRQDGGSFRLLACDFDNNTYSVKGDNLSGNSLISACDVIGDNNQIDDGVLLSSQTGAMVSVWKSKFDNNRAGLQSFNMDVRVACSDFTSNSFGGIINASGTLDVGGDAGNTFEGNGTRDIYVTGDYQQTHFFMDEGHNAFSARGSGQGVYVRGNILNGLPQFLNSSNKLPADYNKMPTYTIGSTTYMPVDFQYKPVGSGYVTVPLDIPNNAASPDEACQGSSELPSDLSPMGRMIDNFGELGGRIEMPGLEEVNLTDAVVDAINKMTYGEEENNDLAALTDFIAILNADISNADESTPLILAGVYHQMFIALNNCYQFESLEHYGGQSSPEINSTVQSVISIIDGQLEGLESSNEEHQSAIFSKTFDKVHVYRLAGCYGNALSLLSSAEEWTFDEEQGYRASYWQCICSTEDDYYDGKISQENYVDKVSACQEYYTGSSFSKTGSQDPFADITQPEAYEVEKAAVNAVEFVLYPQPTNDKLYISTNIERNDWVNYQIIDPLGKVVKHSSFKWQGTPEGIDVSSLESGVYIIHFDGVQKSFKFIKL